MSGHAVSRLPSFGCLRDRILKQQEQKLAGDNWSYPTSSGFRVSRENGAAIINPAADLKETQAKFEPPVQRLSGWETIIKREPNEKEMKSILESRNIFLYFGHGSGAQYIRSRTIKKLSKCAVTLLMGCSSGALTEAGDFEPYGTPMNYLQAGCPALLATLWDVTDKDIDNFSYEVLEKWGLFSTCQSKETSIPTKRNERNKGAAAIQRGKAPENELMSLDQAVARARGSCKLRYLNGAAPVVYGIPVFLS